MQGRKEAYVDECSGDDDSGAELLQDREDVAADFDGGESNQEDGRKDR